MIGHALAITLESQTGRGPLSLASALFKISIDKEGYVLVSFIAASLVFGVLPRWEYVPKEERFAWKWLVPIADYEVDSYGTRGHSDIYMRNCSQSCAKSPKCLVLFLGGLKFSGSRIPRGASSFASDEMEIGQFNIRGTPPLSFELGIIQQYQLLLGKVVGMTVDNEVLLARVAMFSFDVALIAELNSGRGPVSQLSQLINYNVKRTHICK